MISETITLKGKDEFKVHVRKWAPEAGVKPKAAIQLAHGMAEHIERYDDFARALVNEGFVIYGNDHRGHGKTVDVKENIGYFADENGWELVIDDMHRLTELIKKEYNNLPIILFGHSMGSILSRGYIQVYGQELNGVILSGTSGNKGLALNVAILVAKLQMKKVGEKEKSKLMDKLMFGNFNSKFKPNRTEFDWLSRDNIQVDKYIEDEFCGEVFTSRFYYDLLKGVKELNKIENIKKIPTDLPICLFSGGKDPVGNNTKGVLNVYNTFKNVGIKDVSYKFYKDGRHEILNEINKNEVYNDIINWIKNHL